MANIRELAAPTDLGLRPDSRADESLANSGRRVAALYGQAAEANADTGRRVANAVVDVGNVAQKAIEHHEISAGAAESAKTLSGLDALWNKTVKDADPNDPTTAAKFREEVVEPTLEKLRGGFMTEGGSRFAEATVERFRNHFNTKTAADMSTLAGIAAKKNVETLTNQLSNAAIRDPSSLKTSLDLVEHSVGAMVDSSPNMDGVTAARVKMDLTMDAQKAIVRAAAIGAIAANPDAGLKEFSSEKYSKYISGAEVKQLEAEARRVQRAERADVDLQRKMAKEAKQEASEERAGQYLEWLHSGDPKKVSQVSAKAISQDRTLTEPTRERMISIVERETKPETDAKISRNTTVRLFNFMRQDNADPVKIKNKIDDEYAAGNLTWGDRTNLIKEVEDRKTPEGIALAQDRAQFFKQYAGAIVNGGIGPDGKVQIYDPQMGSPKLYVAERDARRVEQELKQKNLDPHLAYDPTSEYFLGKRVGKWRGSMQVDLGDKAAAGERITPPSLRGIADLDYSPSRKQYKDLSTGKVYDTTGAEVK